MPTSQDTSEACPKCQSRCVVTWDENGIDHWKPTAPDQFAQNAKTMDKLRDQAKRLKSDLAMAQGAWKTHDHAAIAESHRDCLLKAYDDHLIHQPKCDCGLCKAIREVREEIDQCNTLSKSPATESPSKTTPSP